ncbi:MAG: DUF4007 family protein [Aggregatilineaceae bacterium]
MKTNRIGLTFHETFSLSRPAVGQVLSVIPRVPQKKALKKYLRENTALGTRYIESMPRYATGAGLLDFDRRLTRFGQYALRHDRLLEQQGTQWLMHYYLSAPQGPGPAFWHELVSNFFYVGHEFSRTQLERQIAAFVEQTEGRALAERTIRSTVTIFLGTYLKSDGLGRLGLLQELPGKRYQVTQLVSPPPWAVAYALLDYWDAHFQDQLTVSLDTLTVPGGFTALFLLGQQEFNEVLRALQAERYAEVYRTAPPYQLVLLRRDAEPLLQKLYGTE